MSLIQGPEGSTALTLVDIFKSTARLHPKAVAIDSRGSKVTYESLLRSAEKLAKTLNKNGVGYGDRVTIQLATGGSGLYEAILGVLFSGAAYVPVDFEDSERRLETVKDVSKAAAHISPSGLKIHQKSAAKWWSIPCESDAWVIFTSGSTGVPKAVAVTHRSAANLVVAERDLFCKENPLAPGTRVAATLSPAFDASIEEMWLAWSTGATLVPIDRNTLTSGPDLADALKKLQIDALSTVPSLARFLIGQDLGALRLLILGGEAVTPDLAQGLLRPKMELWNTYGPTEATIIASAALLREGDPITIGDPIAGAALAVIDDEGHLVSVGATGELVISGIGLGRYLNAELDSQKFKPVPSLGWKRAYFTGDYVRVTLHGLEFVGRIDEQVKVGGKRLDLAEVELAAASITGVTSTAAVAQRSDFGDYSISCFLTVDEGFSNEVFKTELQKRLPAGIRPSVHVLESLPLKTSGKVDKNKLAEVLTKPAGISETSSFTAQQFAKVLHLSDAGDDDNFFELGGTSIKVAQLVVELRRQFATATVADVYKYPTPAALQKALGARVKLAPQQISESSQRPLKAHARSFAAIGLQILIGAVFGGSSLLFLGALRSGAELPGLIAALCLAISIATGAGRAIIAAGIIRLVTLGIKPGRYRRNGLNHQRLWLAERIGDIFSVSELTGTKWMILFARLTGSKVSRGCTIESMPPVLGNLVMGANSSIGRDVHISGWTLQGEELFVAGFEIGSRVRIGNRSFISEGVAIGSDVEVASGSLVDANLADGYFVSGSPMEEFVPDSWPEEKANQRGGWSLAYSLAPSLLGLLYLVQIVPTVLLFSLANTQVTPLPAPTWLIWLIALGPVTLIINAILSGLVIRIATRFVSPGLYAVNSREGFFSWLVERQLQRSRRQSFWLYASVVTPIWARFLGAKVGRNCEISTFNGQIGLVKIGDECFIADDASLAPREVRNGWVRLGEVTLERRTFIGNSGQVRGGVCVRGGTLIGVASEAPAEHKPNSSFFGLPPIEFPRHQLQGEATLRYKPSRMLRAKRFSIELFRLTTSSISILLVSCIYFLAGLPSQSSKSVVLWLLLVGTLYATASYFAALVTVAVKWLLVGRVRSSEHDLWTNFVWRNELVWNFVESVAIPWTGSVAIDTPIHNHILKMLGAKIGKNASISTWFLDDPDLIVVGPNSSLLKAADLQTHLFHDRLMQLAPVSVGANVTVGSGSFILPGASVGDASTIAAGSLVARGEAVAPYSKLSGNPVEHQ